MDKEEIIEELNKHFDNYLVFLHDNSKLSKSLEERIDKFNDFFVIKKYYDKEEPQVIFVKNKKIIYILRGNFDLSTLKKLVNYFYFLDDYEKKIILEDFKRKAKKLRKSMEINILLRLVLVLFISALLVKLAITIINYFMELYHKGQESKFIIKLSSQVDSLIKKESGSFIYSKIEVPSSNTLLVCFTHSKYTSSLFGKNWNFSGVPLEGFSKNFEIKTLSENNQKNVFLIENIYSYKALSIKGLQSSIFEKNPLCFKPGETYYLINYDNIVFITKNVSLYLDNLK